MHYNESIGPKYSRNPLSDKSSFLNTVNNSKKNSVILKGSFLQSKQSVADMFKSRDSVDYTF